MDRELTSLVITTYNRAAMLESTLASVAQSRIDDRESVEVVVVDNNSTDRTREAVDRIRARGFPFTLRYVFERHQGVSWARNRGVDEARGAHVAFMDDDQLIDANYLARLEPAFRATAAACVGGRIFYYNKVSLPAWLPELLKNVGQCDYGDEVKILDRKDGKLHGGNMAFDREQLIEVGKFDVTLGRCGDSLLAAEEDELQERLHAAGQKIAYDPGLIQYHYLAPARLTKRYWRRHEFDYGRTLYRIEAPKMNGAGSRLFGAPGWLWRNLLTRDIPRAVRPLMKLDMVTGFHKQLDVCVSLGRIHEARRAHGINRKS